MFFSSQKWHGRIQKHQRIRESVNQHAWHKFLTEGTIFVAWTQLFCYVKSNSNCCGDRTSQKMAWNDSKHQQINTPQKLLFTFGDFNIGFLAEWWQQLGDSSENFSSYKDFFKNPQILKHDSKKGQQWGNCHVLTRFESGIRDSKVSKLQTL